MITERIPTLITTTLLSCGKLYTPVMSPSSVVPYPGPPHSKPRVPGSRLVSVKPDTVSNNCITVL